MINRKHSILLILSGVLIIAYIAAGCNSKGKNAELIRSAENFTTNGLTLLERTYTDVDSDGDSESVEVYTTAQIAPDG